MSKINLGIIGAGYIANEHLKVLNEIDAVNVKGLASRTYTRAKHLAKIYNIEKTYVDIDSLINECELDGIMILVSVDQIFEVTNKLIPLKIPLFIEKPAGLNPSETKKLATKADNFGTKNMVGYNRRYYSIFEKGIDIIKSSGKLLGVQIEGHERLWKIPKNKFSKKVKENWIYANSTHTIDLLRFFGGEIKSSYSLKKSINEINGDQFTSAIEFKSGTLGTYISNWFSPGGWSVKLYGEGVSVLFSPLEKGIWTNSNFEKFDILPDKRDTVFKPGFFAQAESFIDLIINGSLEYPGQNLEGAYKTMLVAKGIKS